MSIRRLKSRGIGRLELLAWLNEFLETDYTKIEHLADGIAYCQVLDALHPGKVNLQQIQFHARSHGEYEANFRVLQRAFHACGVHKDIPLRKLVDGVFQEHFEFLHWIHDYAHKTYPDAVRKYQGYARRQQLLGTRSQSHTNMNLVPSYSATAKAGTDGFLSRVKLSLDLDLIDVEELPDDLTLDDLAGGSPTASGEAPGEAVSASKVDMEDPLLHYVGNSYAHTLHADQVLAQLERTIALVCAEPQVDAARVKKKDSQSTGAKGVNRRASVKRDKVSLPSNEPPVLRPQLNQLLKALTDELSGRAKDLIALDDEVQSLKRLVVVDTAGTSSHS